MNEQNQQQDNIKEPTLVKTYAEDMAGGLLESKDGNIKKIIRGEEAHEAERKNLSPESAKNEVFMIVGFLLIVVALCALIFFLPTHEAVTVPAEKQFVPLIFNDRLALVEIADLKKGNIAEKVLTELGKLNLKNGGIGGAYLTLHKGPVGLRKFIETIEGSFTSLDEASVQDNFLMGVVKNEKKESPQLSKNLSDRDFFILLKINSLVDVFIPIHAWENKMFADLHGFFGIPLTPETKYLLTKNFEDGIIENKNARILYADGGGEENNIVMMYVLVDDSSIIITNTEHATEEIMRRLASSKIEK